MPGTFSAETLAGSNERFERAVLRLRDDFCFDFVAIGLTAFVGAPLKWIYSAGATGERYRRIVLAPGHGIGGIVIKAGKPMLFTDIDEEIDPREYSSYPIVFAEDLRSFCALPLKKDGRVVGALLCAFRTVAESHRDVFARLIASLDGKLEGLDVVSDDFMGFSPATVEGRDEATEPFMARSDVSRVIAAQEDERRRISRELHDGVAQEVLGVSFIINQLEQRVDGQGVRLVEEARNVIDRILDELHNISVELRPSALDHLGFVPALRSQASVFEKTYGAQIDIESDLADLRFDPALETQVYRICQEAILNACKYSETDLIDVTLEESDGWIHARILDYGKGFDTANPEVKGSGCGLHGMRERAGLIGATLTVESGEDGTQIVLVAPLHYRTGKEGCL